MRSIELLIFGNPNGGNATQQAAQSIGIDLPWTRDRRRTTSDAAR
jgi:hypothetical protein